MRSDSFAKALPPDRLPAKQRAGRSRCSQQETWWCTPRRGPSQCCCIRAAPTFSHGNSTTCGLFAKKDSTRGAASVTPGVLPCTCLSLFVAHCEAFADLDNSNAPRPAPDALSRRGGRRLRRVCAERAHRSELLVTSSMPALVANTSFSRVFQGKDASSGYGGPAISALLTMAAFADATTGKNDSSRMRLEM